MEVYKAVLGNPHSKSSPPLRKVVQGNEGKERPDASFSILLPFFPPVLRPPIQKKIALESFPLFPRNHEQHCWAYITRLTHPTITGDVSLLVGFYEEEKDEGIGKVWARDVSILLISSVDVCSSKTATSSRCPTVK